MCTPLGGSKGSRQGGGTGLLTNSNAPTDAAQKMGWKTPSRDPRQPTEGCKIALLLQPYRNTYIHEGNARENVTNRTECKGREKRCFVSNVALF